MICAKLHLYVISVHREACNCEGTEQLQKGNGKSHSEKSKEKTDESQHQQYS